MWTQSSKLLFHSDFYMDHDGISTTCTSLENYLFLTDPNSQSAKQKPYSASTACDVKSLTWFWQQNTLTFPFCLLFNCPAGCVIIVLQKMCQSDWCPCVMVQSCPRCPLTGWQLFFCGSWILWCSPSSPVPGTGPDLLMLARLSNVNYTLFVLTG